MGPSDGQISGQPALSQAVLLGDPGRSPRHVLVLRAGAIGDFILTLPALVALRAAYPEARVRLVGNSAAVPLALDSGLVDAACSFDAAWVTHLFAPAPSSLQELEPALADIDLAIVWLRNPASPVVDSLRGLGIPTLAAPSFPRPGDRVHVADHLVSTLGPLSAFGGEARPVLLEVPVQEELAFGE